jgi:hypothetical protein
MKADNGGRKGDELAIALYLIRAISYPARSEGSADRDDFRISCQLRLCASGCFAGVLYGSVLQVLARRPESSWRRSSDHHLL